MFDMHYNYGLIRQLFRSIRVVWRHLLQIVSFVISDCFIAWLFLSLK